MNGRSYFEVDKEAYPVFRLLPAGGGAVAASGSLTDSLGRAVTHTRATAATGVNDAGTVISAASGVPLLLTAGVQSEAAATNRAIRSQEFDNAAWTATNVTVTANTHAAPDGTTTADTLEGTASGGMLETTTAFTSSGANATVSLWVRTTEGTQAGELVLRDTTAGADRATASFTATTTWQRVSATTTGATGANNHKLRIFPGTAAGQGTLVVWGAQHETNSCPTGYVVTAGASASRNATVMSYANAAWPVTAATYQCRVRLNALNAATTSHVILESLDASNGISWFITAGTGVINFFTRVATVNQTTSSGNLTWTAGQWYTLRLKYGGGVVQVFRDNVAVIDTTGRTMPSAVVTNTHIGCSSSSTSQLNGTLSDFVVRR